jgi:hypothetical protein
MFYTACQRQPGRGVTMARRFSGGGDSRRTRQSSGHDRGTGRSTIPELVRAIQGHPFRHQLIRVRSNHVWVVPTHVVPAELRADRQSDSQCQVSHASPQQPAAAPGRPPAERCSELARSQVRTSSTTTCGTGQAALSQQRGMQPQRHGASAP